MSGINIKEIQQNRNNNSAAAKPSWNLEKILHTDISFFRVRFTDKHKESFYLELSTLLQAGLDIKSALELIQDEQSKPVLADMIRTIKENLINGDAVWEAMQKSGQFTPYEFYSVQIGEETGKIDAVLFQLYQFYSAKLKQRRQFIGALSYPIIILITSIGAVAFMLLFIVPMFSDVFKRFGGNLPYLTKLIIQISETVKSNFLVFTLVFLTLAFIIRSNRNKDWMRKLSSRVLKYIPVMGKIVYSMQHARFCGSMSLLLGAKVPLVRSLGLIHQMITFYPIQATLDKIKTDILNGDPLHTSMSKHAVYNRKLVSMVKVGEEVNKLDVFFGKLSTQYTNDVEHNTSQLNNFLEPAMIIFLGFVVGFILLAMYLPMFELSTSIGG